MKAIIILILITLSINCNGQLYSGTLDYGNYGYKAGGVFDTIKAVILITECDNCPSKSVSGFAVREKYIYHGDPMPPLDYSDQWQVSCYLNSRKKQFPKTTIIWNSKLLNQKQ